MNTLPKTNTHIHILTHGHTHHVSKGCFIGKIATSVKQGIHMSTVFHPTMSHTEEDIDITVVAIDNSLKTIAKAIERAE